MGMGNLIQAGEAMKHLLTTLILALACPCWGQTNENATNGDYRVVMIGNVAYDAEWYTCHDKFFDEGQYCSWGSLSLGATWPTEKEAFDYVEYHKQYIKDLRERQAMTRTIVLPELTNTTTTSTGVVFATQWFGTIDVRVGVRTNVVTSRSNDSLGNVYTYFVGFETNAVTERYRIGTRNGAVVVEKELNQ